MTPDWSFDPSAVDISDEAQQACDLRFDLDEDHWFSLVEFGTWWVLPIARTYSDQVIGIRLMPGRNLSESAVVKLVEHEAFTLASRPAYLVPRMLLAGALANTDRWNAKRDLRDTTWEELERLHQELTGSDQLASIRAVLNDETHREASGRAFEDPDAFAAQLPSLLCAVDPAPETARFRDYVDRAVRLGDAPLPVPDVGCWTPAAAAVAFVAAVGPRSNVQLQHQLESAWLVVQQPPGLDSFQEGAPTHLAQPLGRSQNGVPRLAARLLATHENRLPSPWKSSSLWPAVRGVAGEGGDYDGVAHMNAAEALKAAGDRPAAFDALVAAAYWMRVANAEPFPPLLQAARILAHDSGWQPVAMALDEIADQVSRTGSA
jgi:hypothetical protein